MSNKIFRVSAITLFFNLAVNTLNFVFGLYFLQITGSAFIFGTLTIIGPLVSLLMTPLMSRIVDSFEHKSILLTAQLITTVALISYEFVQLPGKSAPLITAYLLMVIIRICEELFVVTLKASVAQLVQPNHYQKLNALIQSATSTANILGPILGGVIYSIVNKQTLVMLISFFVVVSIVTIKTIKDNLTAIYQSMFAFTIVIILFGFPKYLSQYRSITILLFSLLLIIFGLIVVYANTAMTTYLQNTVPENKQGGVYSIVNAISQLFVPLGSLGYGLLFDHFDSSLVLIISGGIASIVIQLLLSKNKRNIIAE